MLLLLFPMPGLRDDKMWRASLEAIGCAVDGCDGCGVVLPVARVATYETSRDIASVLGDRLEKLRLG